MLIVCSKCLFGVYKHASTVKSKHIYVTLGTVSTKLYMLEYFKAQIHSEQGNDLYNKI